MSAQSRSQVLRGHCSCPPRDLLADPTHALYPPHALCQPLPLFRPAVHTRLNYFPLCDPHSLPVSSCYYALPLCRQQTPSEMDQKSSRVPGKLKRLCRRHELTTSELIPNRYIVEFDTAASLKASNLKRSTVSYFKLGVIYTDGQTHEIIYSQLKARGVDFQIHQEYTSDLFVGASISVDASTDMMAIAGADGVIVRPMFSGGLS